MRVLLIQPPVDLFEDDERQAMPPLGLAYVAAVLERACHEVRILDSVVSDFPMLRLLPDGRLRHGLDAEGLSREIRGFNPQVVGVSNLFSAQSGAAHDVCRVVKETDAAILTVMGGAHPSAVPEHVLADANVDYVIRGEGELPMLHLVEALQRGRRVPDDPAGLAFREGEHIRICPPAPPSTDLDALPLPARHLLPMQQYFRYRAPHGAVVRRHPCTNMITSRGCPARCSFCSIHTVWGRRFRWHSAARVVREIEVLVKDYGVREIQFEDDNLTLNKPRMREICETMIDRRFDVLWTTPNGVATWALDERLLDLMRRAGCYHIALAVESGSQDTLDRLIHKPLDLSKVPPIVRAARKLGMGVSAFFVVGFPGETRAEIQKTFDYAMNLGADHVHFFTATPYPGTELFGQCVEMGLLKMPVDYAQLRVGRPIISTAEWTAAELSEMTGAAQARFYRSAVIRRPVRFAATVARKLAREPRVTMRKAWRTLFPGETISQPLVAQPAAEPAVGPTQNRRDEEVDGLLAAAESAAKTDLPS
jgi:anaerobic magnesium-protoporphyrin IX monomethyl ester cyclase